MTAPSVTLSAHDWAQNSVRFEIGPPLGAGAKPVAKVGSRSFQLTAENGRAFARGEAEDRLLRAMKAGDEVAVSWAARDGTQREERYSLHGFSSAFTRIATKCR
jgi:hypothetical protein